MNHKEIANMVMIIKKTLDTKYKVSTDDSITIAQELLKVYAIQKGMEMTIQDLESEIKK